MPTKRLTTPERRDQQLLVRVTREQMEVLESAAHLEGTTPNTYVFGLIRAHTQALLTNPHVVADRENRRNYRSATSLRSLREGPRDVARSAPPRA